MYYSANFTGAAPSGSLDSNRRRKARVKVSTTAVVWPAYEAPYNAHGAGRSDLQVSLLESLSMTGLSFWSVAQYACGGEIWIRFRIGSRTCQLRGIVRHANPCVRRARAGYLCGVEFLQCQQTTHSQQIVTNYLTPSEAAAGV